MPHRPLQHLKIMIVDAQPLDVLLLEDMLDVAGFHHRKGLTDVKLMLSLFGSYQPDLVIMGIGAEDNDAKNDERKNESAMSLLKRLRNTVEDSDYRPILVLLNQDDSALKRKALQHGATDLLLKPLDHTDAMLRINNLLLARSLHLKQVYNASHHLN